MQFIQDTLVWFYEGLVNVLNALVKPLTDFVLDTLYFFEKFFDIVVLVLKVILSILKLFGSTVVGVFATISNFLTYNGSGTVGVGKMQAGISKFMALGNTVGLNIIPYVLTFAVVVVSSFTLLKVLREE